MFEAKSVIFAFPIFRTRKTKKKNNFSQIIGFSGREKSKKRKSQISPQTLSGHASSGHFKLSCALIGQKLKEEYLFM